MGIWIGAEHDRLSRFDIAIHMQLTGIFEKLLGTSDLLRPRVKLPLLLEPGKRQYEAMTLMAKIC
jgi:hypothetical protein